MSDIIINGITYPAERRVAFPGTDGKEVIFDLPTEAEAALNPTSKRPPQTKAVYEAVQDVRQRQTSPFNFKGAVADLTALNAISNPAQNDTYYVVAEHCRYSWTGSAWQQSSMDESDYEDELGGLTEASNAIMLDYYGELHKRSLWSVGAFEGGGYSALTNTNYAHSTVFPPANYRISIEAGYYFEVYYYVSASSGTYVRGMNSESLSFTAENPFVITVRKNPSASISEEERNNLDNVISVYEVTDGPGASETVAGLGKTQTFFQNLLFFYGAQRPTFVYNADQSITVTVPDNARGVYAKDGKLNSIATYGNAGSFDVPESSRLVYNITDDTFAVMTSAEINASTDDLIIAFMNHRRNVYGQWERYVVKDTISSAVDACKAYTDNAVGLSGLPDYYTSYMETRLRAIRSRIADAGSRGVSFAFLSDPHYDSDGQNNMRYSPLLLREISKHTSVKMMICGGDMITSSGSRDGGILLEQDVITDFRTKCQMDTFWTLGNHEYNNPGADPSLIDQQLSMSEIYPTITQGNPGDITLSPETGAYYMDDRKDKVRFLFNACNMDSSVNTDSVDWLIGQLPSTPADYDIILISHLGIYRDNSNVYTGPVDDFTPLLQALQAYKLHGSFTHNGQAYNFAGKTGTVLGAFLGHYHSDGAGTWYNIPCVIITTDSLSESGYSGITRTAGTTTEQAFDVVTIDRDAKKIYCTRIGSGEDRQIGYT